MKDLPEFPQALMAKRFPGGFSLRDEANAIVAYAFRNGPIEDLHAGLSSELLADSKWSRITDTEMKTLMVFACRKVEELLRLKATDFLKYETLIKSYSIQYCANWER